MRTATPPTAVLLISAVCLSVCAGCRHPHTAAPTPPPPSPKPRGMVVLVPDPDDGSVGRVAVSTPGGNVELTAAYEATRLTENQPPSPVTTLPAAEVDRLFGSVLAGLPKPARHFTLYFEYGKDRLTPESRDQIPEIVQLVQARPYADVIVVGHTDTAGDAASNYALGLRRAYVVRDLLVSAGLQAAAVEATSHGEGDLLVPTADETDEPRNRRVEIDIQ
jgi:outer membrane protein OmpA-like peptidoglycan-associated protein